ncbi:MAG: glycosyltransferase family 4 protein [Cyanobacteria bacterium Co-bin13]|nr:glycosyltransferase family 4 protein [Cyanobacteria bacterium Co-bin13]
MPVTDVDPVNSRLSLRSQAAATFVFLEVFSCEGGIQSYVKDVLRAYLRQPDPPVADVFLLRDGPNCGNPLEGSALRFHYLDSPVVQVGRVRLVMALALHLWQQRPQQVICGHVLLAPLVYQLCRLLGLPHTVMTYGKEVWFPLPPRDQQALQRASAIWCISRYSRDLACAANDLSPEQMHLLPCVVDGTVFTPGPPAAEWVQQYGLQGCKVLMTVARLWAGDIYKGVDVTIRALPAIAATIPTVKYLVIGRGDDQPRLAQLAQDLGVADRVVFAGFVPTAQLPDHYRLANAYVMPSQEGFGIVYLEAMACGIPVLAGDADGSADPLQNGRLGWRVPHRDPEAVARACIEILKGEDPRCRGDWLRQETLTHFSPEALAAQLNQLLQSPKLTTEGSQAAKLQ